MNGVHRSRPMLPGNRVYRIYWVPGADRLRAMCHCSAERDFDGPVELWEWLLAHPDGHDTPAAGPACPPVRPRVLASPEIEEEMS